LEVTHLRVFLHVKISSLFKGKANLVTRFVDLPNGIKIGKFLKNSEKIHFLETYNDEIHRLNVKIPQLRNKLKLEIVYIGFMEEYAGTHYRHYRECDAIVILYNVTSRDSFGDVTFMCDQIKTEKEGKKMNTLLVG
jgi:hypothetical protein